MKHRLVPGSPARCVTTTVRNHGFPLRPSLAQHRPLPVAIVSHGLTCHVRRKTTPSGETWLSTPHLRPSIHPHSSTSPASGPPLPMGEQLRHMMRLLPHSVSICTSSSGILPRGMTVSSFTSLSLTPPLVTFHVAAPSRTLDAIRSSGRLNFHVLAGDARGARAAHHFTGGNVGRHTWSSEGLSGAGLEVVTMKAGDPPVLTGEGVMYVLKCRLFDEEPATGGVVMVRDHAIVVAEVLEVFETSETTDGHEQFGLVYADRHYRMLGKTLVRKDGTVQGPEKGRRGGRVAEEITREGQEAA